MIRQINVITGEVTVIATDAPSFRQTPSERRPREVLNKAAFCIALKDLGVLPAADAVAAARGGWPATFAAAASGLTPDQTANAMIRWAGVEAIHYAHPLPQALALTAAGGDQTAATALLDQIFGIS